MVDETAKTTTPRKTAAPKVESQLAAALAEFQKDIPSVSKSAKVDAGRMKYNYATLEDVTAVVLPKLAALGISYVAAPTIVDGVFVLDARLYHHSGETVGGYYPLGSITATAQAKGSEITYARRYALLSLTGVAPEGEDDDGKRATDSANAQADRDVTVAQANAAHAQAQASVAAAPPKADELKSLKGQVTVFLTARGDIDPNGDIKAQVTTLGDAFFSGRAGWSDSPVALRKWVAELSKGEVK